MLVLGEEERGIIMAVMDCIRDEHDITEPMRVGRAVERMRERKYA